MTSLTVNQAKLLTDMALCIDYYRLHSPGLMVSVNASVALGAERRAADLIAMVNFGPHKQCSVSADGMFFDGPPNFVLDIYRDDESYQAQRALFEAGGVVEYVSVEDRQEPILRWNRSVDGEFNEVAVESGEIIESDALPGLWIPVDSLGQRDWFAILAAIQLGVSRKAHHNFMATIWS